MKLTPELIAATQSYLNPLQDRELDLRGHKIPAIENLGVTRDQVDTLDLTDNDILTLANFPHLDRLAHLLLSNNLISRIEPRLAFAIPRLTTLVLTNNEIASFAQLAPLGKFPMLEYLTLIGNPVAREKYYREWVVWKCKTVRVLDYRRVKDRERELARSLMQTSDGRPTALAVQMSAPKGSEGEEHRRRMAAMEADSRKGKGSAGRLMTKEERRRLEEAIDRSESLEEIRRLEERLRLGYAVDDSAVASLASSSSNKENTATSTANKGKKRKKGEAGAENDGDGEAGA